MKELKLNNSIKIDDKIFISKMTFREYLNFINDNDFEVDGFHRAIPIAEMYNNNEDINIITDFEVTFHIESKEENIINLVDNQLIIKADAINLCDGSVRTLIIQQLDERFLNSKLLIRVIYSTIDEVRSFITQNDWMNR